MQCSTKVDFLKHTHPLSIPTHNDAVGGKTLSVSGLLGTTISILVRKALFSTDNL